MLAGTLLVGIVVERVALRTLYARDHLDQVLATFGLILFFNELVRIIWGRAAVYMSAAGLRCRATSSSSPGCAIRSTAS